MQGGLIVISGPSGVGKGTLIGKLMEKRSDLAFSVSATTRAPRVGECEGVNYYYITKEQFLSKINNGEILEYTCYNGNYYGTLKSSVDSLLKQGKRVILDIEVEGAANVKKLYPECVTIFVLPPQEDVLYDRLKKRNTEDEQTITKRLARAKEELRLADNYDYKIINNDIDETVLELDSIIDKI